MKLFYNFKGFKCFHLYRNFDFKLIKVFLTTVHLRRCEIVTVAYFPKSFSAIWTEIEKTSVTSEAFYNFSVLEVAT